jgi:acetyl-CoA carboxylase biotin carboxylase subunit
MRAVWKEEDLLKHGKVPVKNLRCFGNDGMYLEKLIEEPRHIEKVGDSYGKACHLLKETVPYKDVIKKLTEETPSIYDRRIAFENG